MIYSMDMRMPRFKSGALLEAASRRCAAAGVHAVLALAVGTRAPMPQAHGALDADVEEMVSRLGDRSPLVLVHPDAYLSR